MLVTRALLIACQHAAPSLRMPITLRASSHSAFQLFMMYRQGKTMTPAGTMYGPTLVGLVSTLQAAGQAP
jgi:hypothetical protein